jgi:3-hydroxyacyl-[acyl-carrier-protein] dehydratase
MVHERVFSIGHDHPSLAGHFPGYPVVPGVVLLNEALDILRRGSAASLLVTGLPMVKFTAPLMPGEILTIRVDEVGVGRATFTCQVDMRLVASGVIEFMSATATQVEQV